MMPLRRSSNPGLPVPAWSTANINALYGPGGPDYRPMEIDGNNRYRVLEVNDVLETNADKRHTLLELTEGFYAGKWKPHQVRPLLGGYMTLLPDDAQSIRAMAFAFSEFNRKEGTKLEPVQLVSVNCMLVNGLVYYLTVKASDNSFYEAEVCVDRGVPRELYFLRPARYYPPINPEFRQYEAPDSA